MDVEVVFSDICGAYYKAKLLDIDTDGGKCLASFEDNWKPNMWVELQHVRFPPSPPPSDSTLDLTTGTKIEAFLPFQEGEPAGWWLATVTKSKGEVAGVAFQSGDRQFTDLVDHQSLRIPNENPSLASLQFFHKSFPVPDDIQEFCQDAKVHQNFRSKVKAINVSYDVDKTSLIVISDNRASLEKAELLIDMHLSDLSTQASLRSKTEKAAQRLQGVSSSQPLEEDTTGVYEEKFHIFPECIGFAMGRQGWNVNQARQLPGIISIDFDDFGSTFTVKAESKEAAQEARLLLEFTRHIMHVPRDLAGKVIGRGGNVIQQILEKSKLNNIKVIGDEEAQERRINTKGEVPFELLGRRKAIEDAKLMLEYHLDHLREVNNILQDREEISQKLRDSGLDDTPTYFPRPNPPRGMMGSSPQTRGGRRGRRPGRGGRPRQGGRRPRQQTQERGEGEEKEEEEEEEGTPQDGHESDQSHTSDEQQQEGGEQQKGESHSEEEQQGGGGGEQPPADRRRRRRRGSGRHVGGADRRGQDNTEEWPEPEGEAAN